jgi:hypothetical protein
MHEHMFASGPDVGREGGYACAPARVAELVYAAALKAAARESVVGSNPTPGTIQRIERRLSSIAWSAFSCVTKFAPVATTSPWDGSRP